MFNAIFEDSNDILLLVLIGIIILLLISFGIYITISYVKKIKRNKNDTNIPNQNNRLNNQNIDAKDNNSLNQNKNASELENELNKKITLYNKYNEEINNVLLEQRQRLLQINNIDIETAKKWLLDNLEKSLQKEKSQLINHYSQITNQEINDKVQNIIINAFESINDEMFVPKTSFTIKLTDDNIKGRIIGKEGRNKRTFESITGVDLLIEKDPEVVISSFNPIRREIAKNVLTKLIANKHIEPSKIEKYYEQEKEIIQKKIEDLGYDMVENQLQIYDVNKGIYPYVGKLFFRTSYAQNILQHSKECAMLAVNIARQLGVDTQKAKKAAFFHDIGKSVDFEIDNDHVESGIKIAKEFGLDDYILNAIESHHDKIPVDNIYSAIVKVVDKISAARPGARLISLEEYIERVNTIESICNSFDGVKTSYALKAGRQVRIIVDAKNINDDAASVLANDIKVKLESDPIVNKQPIDVVLIREKRIELKSSGTASRIIK